MRERAAASVLDGLLDATGHLESEIRDGALPFDEQMQPPGIGAPQASGAVPVTMMSAVSEV